MVERNTYFYFNLFLYLSGAGGFNLRRLNHVWRRGEVQNRRIKEKCNPEKEKFIKLT